MTQVCFTRDAPDETVQSVSQFLEQIGSSCHGEWSFRGHREDKAQSLSPSIGREFNYVGQTVRFTPAQELSLLQRFRRHAYKHYNRVLTEWEVLFGLARGLWQSEVLRNTAAGLA